MKRKMSRKERERKSNILMDLISLGAGGAGIVVIVKLWFKLHKDLEQIRTIAQLRDKEFIFVTTIISLLFICYMSKLLIRDIKKNSSKARRKRYFMTIDKSDQERKMVS